MKTITPILSLKHKLTIIALLIAIIVQAQNVKERVEIGANLAQYPASLLVPKFSPLHLGANINGTLQLNKNEKCALKQSLHLGYFSHQYLQKAVMLYTEIGYTIQLGDNWVIQPFNIGGGYTLSITHNDNFIWNEDLKEYEYKKWNARNNWMISVGPSFGYTHNKLRLLQRQFTFLIDYRIQIQGTLINESVPLLAYAPIKLGIVLPLSKSLEE